VDPMSFDELTGTNVREPLPGVHEEAARTAKVRAVLDGPSPRTAFISFAELAKLAPKAGLWCTAYNGTFLERIEYDDSDSANMEIVDERVDEIAFGCDECGVSDGDWVIRGIKGEFYPCKHDIFEASYKAVP